MKFLMCFMIVTFASAGFAVNPAQTKPQPLGAASTKKLCKLSGPDNSKAIAAFDVIDAKDRDPPVEHIVTSSPSYDRTLINGVLNWECKVKDLNQILGASRACIVLANNISVTIQIPDPKTGENYEKIVKAFEKNGCLKDVGPILDVVPM